MKAWSVIIRPARLCILSNMPGRKLLIYRDRSSLRCGTTFNARPCVLAHSLLLGDKKTWRHPAGTGGSCVRLRDAVHPSLRCVPRRYRSCGTHLATVLRQKKSLTVMCFEKQDAHHITVRDKKTWRRVGVLTAPLSRCVPRLRLRYASATVLRQKNTPSDSDL